MKINKNNLQNSLPYFNGVREKDHFNNSSVH